MQTPLLCREWLEVKPETTAALEKIIGEHTSWDAC